MPLLPKPYPDEVIGSVIARACWHSGLPLKRLLEDVFGSSRSYNGFLVGAGFQRIGLLSGTDAEEILMCHTVFPYSTAFMSGPVRTALAAKALNHKVGEVSLSSLTKNVSHGVPYRRVCPACIAQDMAIYGESYWRRAHLLPGVLMCLQHGGELQATVIALRCRAQSSNILLPHMAHAETQRSMLADEKQYAVADHSVKALNWEVETPADWLAEYRSRVIEAGYQLPSGDVAALALATAIQNYFGAGFLEDSGCPVAKNPGLSWPTLMVRPGIGIPFAPPKHLYFQVFITDEANKLESFSTHYLTPGRRPQDYERLDTLATQKLKNDVERLLEKNMRISIEQLLRDAGVWASFRHGRERFPQTNAFIQQFRTSEQSERQIGGRANWRKRFPKRFASQKETFNT